MQDKYHALQSALIAVLLLLLGIVAGKMCAAEPDLAEQTLKAIEDCMARSPGEWPDEWKQQYLETKRRAVESHHDTPHYAIRLEILRKGFAICWDSVTKIKDKSLFEVYRTRIRWYTEHLMGTKFPSAEERQKLRDRIQPRPRTRICAAYRSFCAYIAVETCAILECLCEQQLKESHISIAMQEGRSSLHRVLAL